MKDYVSILNSPIDHETLRLWTLVLAARGIPFSIKKTQEGYEILVPEESFYKAIGEIRAFEEENQSLFEKGLKRHSRPFKYLKRSLFSILIMASLMSLTFRYEVRELLMKAGEADSSRILEGEIWRAVTSLTLHTDPAHFFSNVFIGAIFLVFLFEETGLGAGWLLVTLGGAFGNLINAYIHGPGHHSIGFSTSIFSALGSLSAIKAFQMRKEGLKEAFKITFSGLALLGLLGTGKEGVDISAHFFGYLSGVLLGLILEKVFGKRPPSGTIDKILLALAILIYTGSWGFALYH